MHDHHDDPDHAVDEIAAALAAIGTKPRGFRRNRADKRREGQRGEGRHLRARPGKLAPHPLATREVTA